MNTFAIKGPNAIKWKVAEEESTPSSVHKLIAKLASPGAIHAEGENPPSTISAQPAEIQKTTPEEPGIDFSDLIGVNNLKEINYLLKAISASKSVGRIIRSDGGMATGFMLTEDLMITNFHVLANKEQATGAKVEFNYQLGLDGTPLKSHKYTCDPDDLFTSNETLDYAITRVKSKPGKKWGYLTLKPKNVTIKVNDKVNIIQHPGGKPKMIAMNDNELKFVDPSGQYIQYITDASEGSSGSPVFNDNWQVVALHSDQSVSENGLYIRNEGKRIDAIIADLTDAIRNEILG